MTANAMPDKIYLHDRHDEFDLDMRGEFKHEYIRADIVKELARAGEVLFGIAHEYVEERSNAGWPDVDPDLVGWKDALSRINAIMEGKSRGPNDAQWYRGNEPWEGPKDFMDGMEYE